MTLSDGGTIEGGTEIPGFFGWSRPSGLTGGAGTCAVASGTVDVGWTPSDGTWAYIADAMLHGVAAPLAELGVPSAVDSVSLFGVAVARADTAIAFPDEFSMDDDVDYEAPLVEVLEAGLGPEMLARVSVMAIDRNFTNWIRDPVFNPSGTVRIPSLRGTTPGSSVHRSCLRGSSPATF